MESEKNKDDENEEEMQKVCKKYEGQIKELVTNFVGDFFTYCEERDVRSTILRSGGQLVQEVYRHFSIIFGLSFHEDVGCIGASFGVLLAQLKDWYPEISLEKLQDVIKNGLPWIAAGALKALEKKSETGEKG